MKTKILALVLIALTLFSCTSNKDFEKGKKQLENQGYTDVVNTGHNYYCCSNDELYSTGFKAKDKNGDIVEGCFCLSILKGITIRFE